MSANIIGYYQIDQSEGFDVFVLVLKDFWDANQHMDDSGSEEAFIPKGFYALCEGMYEHDLASTELAQEALKNGGWVENKMFQAPAQKMP